MLNTYQIIFQRDCCYSKAFFLLLMHLWCYTSCTNTIIGAKQVSKPKCHLAAGFMVSILTYADLYAYFLCSAFFLIHNILINWMIFLYIFPCSHVWHPSPNPSISTPKAENGKKNRQTRIRMAESLPTKITIKKWPPKMKIE